MRPHLHGGVETCISWQYIHLRSLYKFDEQYSCSRNQQQQGQQFTGCEHTDHLHKRFYFSSTRQLSLQACCLWTKMEQQFPKIGGPENRAQKSFQNWTYLLAEREEVFSLFYTLGSQIMTPKWAQNWDPKMGSKLLLQPLKPPQKHTHTHRHTFAGQKNKNCKAGPAKNFCRSQIKNPLWGARRAARNSWLQAPPINTHDTETHDTGQPRTDSWNQD